MAREYREVFQELIGAQTPGDKDIEAGVRRSQLIMELADAAGELSLMDSVESVQVTE